MTDPMRVLMLGWEYPPHIAGGLGTACAGLTHALASSAGIAIDFVVPRAFGDESTAHMNFFGCLEGGLGGAPRATEPALHGSRRSTSLTYYEVPSFLSPYSRPQALPMKGLSSETCGGTHVRTGPPQCRSDLFSDVVSFQDKVIDHFASQKYDLIHAHDWMTFPAAVALKKATATPLVTHIHSIERDRAGEAQNHFIYHIESAGVHEADAVIAVSEYTQSQLVEHYHVDRQKVAVAHNGIALRTAARNRVIAPGGSKEPTILFLGRVTYQKGPDYFVEAAARALGFRQDLRFVVAGDGDMLPHLQKRVSDLGMASRFHFPGFLVDGEVSKAFARADLFVMPSVSEPFGLVALEAASHGVPVILSRQSGVREVLRNALRVDFWDVERLAELIMACIAYPELCTDMASMATDELSGLSWERCATKVKNVYRSLLG